MSTKTITKDKKKSTSQANGSQQSTPKKVDQLDEKSVQLKEKEIEKSKATITDILNPSAKSRINRLETMQILADKFNSVSKKQDELNHFLAGNDGTGAEMRFSSQSNYSFTIKNPIVINQILGFVEKEMEKIVEKAENEILSFNI